MKWTIIFLMVATAALAQDTVVSNAGWVEAFLPFITAVTVALIGALVPIIALYLKNKYNIDWELEQRDAFQTSLTNAAGQLIQRVGAQVAMTGIDVRSKELADLIRYVQTGAPTAVREWGITPERIAEGILSKIPQVLGQPTPTPTTSPI